MQRTRFPCFLVRHGETEWSLSHRHTGRTDLPLLPEGRTQAVGLQGRLVGHRFAAVLESPLLRARETCRLAAPEGPVEVDPDLAEWDYGAYEGRTTAEIRSERPGWDLFDDGAPGGEDVAAVARRVDRVIARVRSTEGETVCFAHGHVLRVLAARWAGWDPAAGRGLLLDPASLSVLGWERDQPVIAAWNLR
jgi:probable phosphoglycerate mutase